jgi:hypothetical protein
MRAVSFVDYINISRDTTSGFGGLEVACWSLVPKFVGSHPAEVVGFLGRQNPQHAKVCILLVFLTYRVIQEESAILWEMIVCVILRKKVHINMCPIFDGYGVMGIF